MVIAALEQRKQLLRFVSMRNCQSSSVTSKMSFGCDVPALFTRISRRPNSSATVAKSLFTSSSTATFARTLIARRPSWWICGDHFFGPGLGTLVVDHDVGALFGQHQGDSAPQSSRRTGHHSHFSRQFRHGESLLLVCLMSPRRGFASAESDRFSSFRNAVWPVFRRHRHRLAARFPAIADVRRRPGPCSPAKNRTGDATHR